MNLSPIPMFLVLSILLFACGGGADVESLPAITENGYLRAIIEIPAGTNHKIIYDAPSRNFMVEQQGGADRVIDFLPYPANYGFIPSTRMDSAQGGDGDALDVFVIGESIPTAIAIEVIPLAVAYLMDDGEADHKILALPANENQRIVQATTLGELKNNYPAVLDIMELWLTHYDRQDSTVFKGWGDEKAAQAMVEKWIVPAP